MLTDLNTSVTDISPEQLDALFSTTPDSTVTADNLALGKDDVVKVGDDDLLPTIDLDKLEADAAKDDEEKKDDEGDKDKLKTDAKPAEAADDKKKADDKSADTPVDVSVLKSTINYLVDKGIFKDFQGREDLEMTEELYAELVEAQVNEIVNERYTSKKNSAGDYGQAILDFIENGGDPDQIIDLFKERKQVAEFDLSTEEAKKEIVSKYYKEVYGWKPARIERELKNLELEEDGLDTEASDIKAKYEEHYKKQTAALAEQQAADKLAYEQEQKRRQTAFESSIKEAIKGYEADDARKQAIENSLFKTRKLKDGTTVNDFYVKFAEWQSDPKKYVELVEFITDHENYIKRKEQVLQNKVVNKTFNFVRGNQTVSKNKGSEHTTPEQSAKAAGTDFSIIFKNK